ncbi:ribonuclease H-like domain-containing protein [Hominifimenecus sp. rT4P-3]|uniref:ribonuclease H-like domain-containing protein n=1 Tax=Hominifimenecus sp. rT4P-3 TaxID=3242979 RepID=UPI003DA6981E
MKTIEKEFFLHTDYPLNQLGLEKPLFLDIETTGLSPERSHVYLIGCLFPHTEECWGFRQWLCESPKEEQKLLEQVIAFCRDFSGFVHFNGNRFDLPYLHKRSEHFGLFSPFKTMKSVDLYQKIRTCKNLCNLPDVKQKSIEQFLHIERDDSYSGGELIPIYHQFTKTGNPKLLHFLLLHNEEDVLGMLQLLPMLSYFDLKNGSIPIGCPIVEDSSDSELFLRFSLASSLPQPVSFRTEGTYAVLGKESLRLHTPLFCGELQYYLPNYKDYYYLPAEDTAIHKSVAVYVDPAFRVKATPENCYIKKTGQFLPLPKKMRLETGRPVFQERRNGPSYVFWEESILQEASFWNAYLSALFQSVSSGADS